MKTKSLNKRALLSFSKTDKKISVVLLVKLKIYDHITCFILKKSMLTVKVKNNFVFEDTKGFLDSRSRTDYLAPWPMLCLNA